LQRLARGTATPADIASLGDGTSPTDFVASVLKKLGQGRSLDFALNQARSEMTARARDYAEPPQSVAAPRLPNDDPQRSSAL
jgi:hypothetical protein